MGSSAWEIFNDKLNKIDPPQTYLSFKDLDLLPEFRLCKLRGDTETFKRILFENGIDTNKDFNVTSCLHRPRTSKEPYNGQRVDGTERLDKAWLESGAASEEALFYRVSPEMRDELISLDPHKSLNKRQWMEDRDLAIDFNLDGDDDFYDDLEEVIEPTE